MSGFGIVSMMLCPIPGFSPCCHLFFEDVVQEVISDIKISSKMLCLISLRYPGFDFRSQQDLMQDGVSCVRIVAMKLVLMPR